MVIQSVTEYPRPRIKTSNGVSATSGIVCVTSATGMKPLMKPGNNLDEIANRKANANPAIMPKAAIGRVWPKAAISLPRAITDVSLRNRYSKTP